MLALRALGTARTGAYFSTAPFVGAALSLLLFAEHPTLTFWIAGGLMGLGVWLHLSERHEHLHRHEAWRTTIAITTTRSTSTRMISVGRQGAAPPPACARADGAQPSALSGFAPSPRPLVGVPALGQWHLVHLLMLRERAPSNERFWSKSADRDRDQFRWRSGSFAGARWAGGQVMLPVAGQLIAQATIVRDPTFLAVEKSICNGVT